MDPTVIVYIIIVAIHIVIMLLTLWKQYTANISPYTTGVYPIYPTSMSDKHQHRRWYPNQSYAGFSRYPGDWMYSDPQSRFEYGPVPLGVSGPSPENKAEEHGFGRARADVDEYNKHFSDATKKDKKTSSEYIRAALFARPEYSDDSIKRRFSSWVDPLDIGEL